MAVYAQDPQDKDVVGFLYGPWLEDGETITASTWTQSSYPSGAAPLAIDGQANDGENTQTRLTGGDGGAVYRLTNHIVTSFGRERDRTHRIVIREA